MADSFEITGIEEIVKNLSNLPKQLVASGYVKALDAGINVLAGELHTKTPEREDENSRDEGGLTLKESVTTSVDLDSQLRGGRASLGFGKLNHIARLVEYGHRMVGHEPGKKDEGQVAAHPFIRPAFDSAAQRAIEAFNASLSETFNQSKFDKK